MKVKDVSEIETLAKTVAEPFGFEVVEVLFKNGREPALTIFLDKEGGINLNDCEAYHNAVDPALDELDPTFGAPYTLNVSSPGLDRPFKVARDFERNLNKEVEIKLYAPIKGKKLLEGTLIAFDENSVTVQIKNTQEKISKNKIAKINKAIKFE